MVQKFSSLGGDLKRVQEKFPEKKAVYLASEIRKGITSQAPGGVAFQALAQSTIDRKGSSKALIDTADMRNSVTHQEVESGVEFVGLLRTQQHKKKGASDEDISEANLGYIHEVEGVRAGPGGENRIKRPFIMPVWNVEKPKMERDLVHEVEDALRK